MTADLRLSVVDFFPFILAFDHFDFSIVVVWKCCTRKIMNIDLDDDFGYDIDLALMTISTMARISRILRRASQKYEVTH